MEKTIKEKIECISFLHKQNLNGRETENELFEAGILAGIEETEKEMYSEEDMLMFANLYCSYTLSKSHLNYFNTLPKFKKK